MGKRGPRPDPTALKLLKGNPGKRRLNVEEPQLPPIMAPPKGLDGRALAEWERLAGPLVIAGVLTIADVETFRTYCKLVAEVESYERLVRRVGREDAHRLGYASHLLKLRTQAKQHAETLGLTPSSRSSVKKAVPVSAGDPDADFLFGNRSG